MSEFIAFPSIEGFHNVVKYARAYPDVFPQPITYKAKVKLHGTNSAVRILGDGIYPQSRSQIISVTNDNAGFAKWVETRKDYFSELSDSTTEDITVYGEWAGKGIQSGVSIAQIPNKIFAIFAIFIGNIETGYFEIDPNKIKEMLGTLPSDIKILPWQGSEIVIDFADKEALETVASSLNKIVEEIEACDPFVKEEFGISGTGEGLVYYKQTTDKISYKDFENTTFKVKGEKHKVVSTKKAVQVDPSILNSVNEFVTMFVTENRCMQGVEASNGVDMKNMGLYLKWMSQDILKESKAELAASNLQWKDVEKAVQTAARTWFVEKNKVIV